MARTLNKNKIVVLTGAGVSAESGLKTFRDSDGLWNNYSVYDVATPEAWDANPELVLQFYNERRKLATSAEPNAAHLAIAELEKNYDVIVVTQNVDDLHERAGSTNVIHVHGELIKARSTADHNLIYTIGAKDISLGDMCELGSQLRPHIVWFGEAIHNYEISAQHVAEAAKVLVVGTSLSVYPAAGLVTEAHQDAEKTIVSYDLESQPQGFEWLKGSAANLVPTLAQGWMS